VRCHVLFYLFILALGAKTATVAKLMGGFVVFFLGAQNRNFMKVRGQKLLFSLNFINADTRTNAIIPYSNGTHCHPYTFGYI